MMVSGFWQLYCILMSLFYSLTIQQYRENVLAARAKIQAFREAVLDAQIQQQARTNEPVTYIGGAMVDSSPCATPPNPNGQDFTPCGHVSRPGSTVQSYSLWGSSKGSQTDSEENLYRKRFSRSLCHVVTGCAVVLVILALLGIVGIAVYLGYIANEEETPNHTAKYVGHMRILQGDTWVPALNYPSSPPFRAKAAKYKTMLESVYEHSTLGPAVESSEIKKFNRIKPNANGFEIIFILNLDRRKIPFWHLNNIDLELKSILDQELRSPSPVAFHNVEVDVNTLRIKQLDAETQFQNAPEQSKEKLELVTLGDGAILRVKSPDVQPIIAGQPFEHMLVTGKSPKTSTPAVTSAAEQTTGKTTTTTTTTTTDAATTTTTSTEPTTINNLVYEFGPWKPISPYQRYGTTVGETALQRPTVAYSYIFPDNYDYPDYDSVGLYDISGRENETLFDTEVTDKIPVDKGLLSALPTVTTTFKSAASSSSTSDLSTGISSTSPVTTPTVSEADVHTIGIHDIREFFRTLFTTEATTNTVHINKVEYYPSSTEAPVHTESVTEETHLSPKDIQSVLENLLFIAAEKHEYDQQQLHQHDEHFNITKISGLEGKTDYKTKHLGEGSFYNRPATTTLSNSQEISQVTSYSGVRDFKRPLTNPDMVFPMDRFRIQAQLTSPSQMSATSIKSNVRPTEFSIWDLLTTKKPLILDTEIVTSTSFDVKFGSTPEELRPVYIHSSTIKSLSDIINSNENAGNQITVPVIAGKEVRYIRVNRTRPNYPNVVIVNIPSLLENSTSTEQNNKDSRAVRFNTKFLNDLSKLVDYLGQSEKSGMTFQNDTNLEKSSRREGKPINLDAKFSAPVSLNSTEPGVSALWSVLSKFSKLYLSDPAILQQLYDFLTSSANSQDLQTTGNYYYLHNNSEIAKDMASLGKDRRSGKSIKIPPVTTIFMTEGRGEGKLRVPKAVSVSESLPEISSALQMHNSPIHTFTFNPDQSLDELLTEIFDTLSRDSEKNDIHVTNNTSHIDYSKNEQDKLGKIESISSSAPLGEDALKIIEELSKLLSDQYDNYNMVFGGGSEEDKEEERERETTIYSVAMIDKTTLKPLGLTNSAITAHQDILASNAIRDVTTTVKTTTNTKKSKIKQRPTSFKYYHDLFPVMTRPMHPIQTTTPVPTTYSYNFKSKDIDAEFPSDADIKRNCSENEFRCSDGKCIPSLAQCNVVRDCADNSDEAPCKCSDILKSQHYTRKICDGIIDCWDKSDEINCDWCTPGHFICTGSEKCVEPEKVCNAFPDCPNGEDERDCVRISSDIFAANSIDYSDEGVLMVRKNGLWGKLCVENFENAVSRAGLSWSISDLGEAVCNTLTFDSIKRVERITDTTPPLSRSADTTYYEVEIAHGTESSPRHRELSLDEDSHLLLKRSISQTLVSRYPSSHDIKGSFETLSSFMIQRNLTVKSRPIRDTSDSDLSLRFQSTACPKKDVVKVKCKDLQCGIRPRAITVQARIVGGSNSSPGSWPWHAALYKEGEYQCGATVISSEWLLSAGHCFFGSKQEYWVARMGALRRGTKFPSPFEQVRPISHIFIHPEYVNQGFINDISLLRLESPVNLNDYVRPVCLPSPGSEVSDGQSCTLVGWGQLFEVKKVFPDTLQEVEVPIISTKECRKRTVFLPLYRITEDMFCAGYDRGGRDACLGDSGGPLMCQKSDGQWEVVGVTSNGYGCARPHRPGVYTKIVNYLSWIDQVMELARNEKVIPIKKDCIGHRCPLGQCLPLSGICDGRVECSDGSDEKNCP